MNQDDKTLFRADSGLLNVLYGVPVGAARWLWELAHEYSKEQFVELWLPAPCSGITPPVLPTACGLPAQLRLADPREPRGPAELAALRDRLRR